MPQCWPLLVKNIDFYINAYPLRATSLPPSTTATFRSDPIAIFNAGQLTSEKRAQLLPVHFVFEVKWILILRIICPSMTRGIYMGAVNISLDKCN